MVARVDVPGIGPMYFPEDMSDDDIRARVASLEGFKQPRTPERVSGATAASKDLSSAKREILDTIAGTESPDYNTLYGGKKVADLSRHPGIDVPIMSGPNVGKTSSAFGRYQFTEPTWNEQAKKLGLKDMSPESQDLAAWDKAASVYKTKTGRDLEEDWASGDQTMRQNALRALSGTWTSLPGGIEQSAKYGKGRILDPRDLPTSDLIKGGWHRGIEGFKGTFLDLIPALAGATIGEDDYAKQQLEEYKQRMSDIEAQYPTAYESFKDIGSPGQAFDYAAETLGEIGPDMVAFLTGSGLGASLGKTAARKALESQVKDHAAKYATRLGLDEAGEAAYADRLMDRALVGSFGAKHGADFGIATASGALNIPETFNQVYQDTGELHPGVSTVLGSVKSALDTIVPGRIWGQLTDAGKNRFAAKVLEDSSLTPKSWKLGFFTEAAKTSAAEGLTEGAQQMIDNAASQYAGAHRDIFDNVLDASIRGAIGGGAFGVPGAALQANRMAAAQPRQEPEGEVGAPPQTQQGLGLMPQAPYGGPGGQAGTPTQADMWGYPYLTQGGMERGDERTTGADVAEAGGKPSTVIDESSLERMGFGPRAGFYKDLLGKDLRSAEDRDAVDAVLKRVEKNSKIPRDRKDEIKRIISGLTPAAEQQELPGAFSTRFPASGPGSAGEHFREIQQGKAAADFFGARAAAGRSGAGPALPSGPSAAVPAAGAGVSEAGGVAPAQPLPSGTERRTAPKPSALGYDLGPDIQDPADHKAVATLKGAKNLKGDAIAAQTYLGKMPVLLHNLANIANDLVYPTKRYRPEPEHEGTKTADFYRGTGTSQAQQAARWVQKNLGPEANEQLDNLVAQYQAQKDKTDAADKLRWDADERIVRTDYGTDMAAPTTKGPAGTDFFKPVEAVKAAPVQTLTPEELAKEEKAKLSQPLHPDSIGHIRKGNLSGALLSHGHNIGGTAGKTARMLSKVLGKTKVAASLGLSNAQGKPVPGYFDPKTNTIHLDATTGLNSHALLHEATHAAISHELDNPNSQLARQLTQLFDSVKDSLDSAYGAQDVHEFASEAWSNPEFANLLSSINPGGSKFTAWDRFKRAVINFVRKMAGLPPKPLTSAYDVADDLISQLISSAPASRDAAVLYAPNAGKTVFKGVDRIIDAVPLLNAKQKSALSQAINTGTDASRNGLFALLPVHALTDLAEQHFPGMARRLDDLINLRSGEEKRLNRSIDASVELAKRAIKQSPGQQSRYDDLVHDSTIKEIDPTRPREYYKNDPEKYKDWEKLHSRYKNLDPVWQNLYSTMRDGYKAMYEEIKKSIGERIDDTNISKGAKDSIKADVMKMLMERGLIDPYFALGREGNYWLVATTKDKEGFPDMTVEAFKSTYDRQLRRQQLEKEGATNFGEYSSVNEVDYRRAPAGSFMNSVFQLMQVNGVPDNAIDEMMRLFISTLPETAFAQSFQSRKGKGGRSGYDSDSIGVFERKMRNMAHQVANLKYNPKLRNTVDDMREHAVKVGKGLVEAKDKSGAVIPDQFEPARDNKVQLDYLNEFEKHLKYILNPTKHDLGSILSTTAFHYTLGFNVSSALVNLANVPMIVAPYLSGKYKGANISGALGNATRIFMNSGRKAGIEAIGSNGQKVMLDVMPSMANYEPDSPEGKKYGTLIRIASQFGQLDRSQLYEMINGDTRTGLMPRLNAMSGWAFHHGERMNREVTMMAAYDLELAKLKKQGVSTNEAEERAAREAIRVAELTNGSIAAASAPRIAQSALGKLLFMYKRYGVSMYYMMFKTFREAINKSLPKEERAAAWKQLGGIYGMSALMAGAQGLPLFGAASIIYSMFSDDDDDDLGTATRKYLGDFAYKGPIEYMTNLAIASRISLNDLIVRDTKEGAAATTFSQQMAQALGGPAMGVADRWQRGLSKINEGHFERGMEDLLPSFMANMLKATRYATEGTQTLRGDPITGDVNAWNVGAQFFGLAPADYTRQLEMNARLKGMHDTVVKEASNLKRKYYVASRVNDRRGMLEAKQALLELGAEHPGLGITPATVSESIAKSMKAQKAATKDMRHGVRYSKKMLKEIEKEEDEWNDEE